MSLPTKEGGYLPPQPEILPTNFPPSAVIFSQVEKSQREEEEMKERLALFMQPHDEETVQRLKPMYQRFLKAMFAPHPWQEVPYHIVSDASFRQAQKTIYTILTISSQNENQRIPFQQQYAPEGKEIIRQDPRRISLLIDSFGLLDGNSITYKNLVPVYGVNLSRIGGLRQKTLKQLGETLAFRNFAQETLCANTQD